MRLPIFVVLLVWTVATLNIVNANEKVLFFAITQAIEKIIEQMDELLYCNEAPTTTTEAQTTVTTTTDSSTTTPTSTTDSSTTPTSTTDPSTTPKTTTETTTEPTTTRTTPTTTEAQTTEPTTEATTQQTTEKTSRATTETTEKTTRTSTTQKTSTTERTSTTSKTTTTQKTTTTKRPTTPKKKDKKDEEEKGDDDGLKEAGKKAAEKLEELGIEAGVSGVSTGAAAAASEFFSMLLAGLPILLTPLQVIAQAKTYGALIEERENSTVVTTSKGTVVLPPVYRGPKTTKRPVEVTSKVTQLPTVATRLTAADFITLLTTVSPVTTTESSTEHSDATKPTTVDATTQVTTLSPIATTELSTEHSDGTILTTVDFTTVSPIVSTRLSTEHPSSGTTLTTLLSSVGTTSYNSTTSDSTKESEEATSTENASVVTTGSTIQYSEAITGTTLPSVNTTTNFSITDQIHFTGQTGEESLKKILKFIHAFLLQSHPDIKDSSLVSINKINFNFDTNDPEDVRDARRFQMFSDALEENMIMIQKRSDKVVLVDEHFEEITPEMVPYKRLIEALTDQLHFKGLNGKQVLDRILKYVYSFVLEKHPDIEDKALVSLKSIQFQFDEADQEDAEDSRRFSRFANVLNNAGKFQVLKQENRVILVDNNVKRINLDGRLGKRLIKALEM
uniref:Flocculation protein FLO11 n=1 Tax=Panagrellus redivivus TaxID=6233 RepID=A0A7E4W6A8_PANRE